MPVIRGFFDLPEMTLWGIFTVFVWPFVVLVIWANRHRLSSIKTAKWLPVATVLGFTGHALVALTVLSGFGLGVMPLSFDIHLMSAIVAEAASNLIVLMLVPRDYLIAQLTE